jgi:hypothetical protein
MFNIHNFYDYLFELRALQLALPLTGRLAIKGFNMTDISTIPDPKHLQSLCIVEEILFTP